MTRSPTENDSVHRDRLLAKFGRWLKRHPVAAGVVLTALIGLGLGWEWLAASGLLFVALAGLGCLLMCVFGLHGGRHSKGSDGD